LINDKEGYSVVAEAIRALSDLDFDKSAPLIREQAKSKEIDIRSAAMDALISHSDPAGASAMFESLDEMQPDEVQDAGIRALGSFKGDDPRIVPFLRKVFASDNTNILFRAIQIARTRKIKEVIPDLQAVKAKYSFAAQTVDAAIAEINK
jgi:HEAT repeat protein